MQKLIEDALKDISTDTFYDPEELQREVDFYRAQSISSRLMKTGMITKRQFNKLTGLNLSAFAPRLGTLLAE